MNVGELQQKLVGLDPSMNLAVYRESEAGTEFFEVSDVSPSQGRPIRHEATRKAGFKFDGTGPATWLFISIDEA
jgi:hypothetical protein